MKSAEECVNCGCQRSTHPIPECKEFVASDHGGKKMNCCLECWAQALTEFRKDNPIRMTDGEKAYWEARVKEARAEEHDRIRLRHAEDLLAVRAEAIENCAKVAESINSENGQYYGGMIAKSIRTLKTL